MKVTYTCELVIWYSKVVVSEAKGVEFESTISLEFESTITPTVKILS